VTYVRPRRLVHRGSVEAAGFLLDARLAGLRETRRRILELWSPGVQAYRVENGYCVRLAAPRRVDSWQSPGAPLVLTSGVASALPLAQDELSAFDAPRDSVVKAAGGLVSREVLDQANLEAPEDWLDLSGFELLEVKSLGQTYERPRVVAEPEPFDAREKLDGVPEAAPELLETLAALKEGQEAGANKAGAAVGSGAGKSFVEEAKARVFGFFRALKDSGRDLLRSLSRTAPNRTVLGGAGKNSGRKGAGSAATQSAADTLTAKEKLSLAWRRFAARVLHTTRLSSILGRRQATYVARMMQMFEEGDLGEALRHAIPINDLPSSLRSAPSLGVPSPRASLNITPRQARTSTSIGMDGDMLSYMRQLYRNAFERLVAQRRFEEAAFVLAELLRDNAEAVAFLERHGKLRLAAELAEARNLPPGLVVRQWFLAGDIERAVQVARRTQAFADAVARLEKGNREKAEQLRVVWAEALAEAGSYAAAVDAIWPVEAERRKAREWMDKAIEAGGPSAARMLARKLSLVPDAFEEVRERALVFLEDESFENSDSRLLFAETLCQGARSEGAQALARAAARAILRDAGQDCHAMQPAQFKSLVDFSGDNALRTDLPAFPVIQSYESARARETLRLEFSAMDCGPTPLADACLLGDGRLLVALFEAGVKLVTRDGRAVAHFDQPAARLVLSDHGDRAIALAPRGEVWRLARLDLLARRSEEWCEARIDAFAPDYDGTLWFLGAQGDFYAVDATAKSFDALWRVPEAGAAVVGVARSDNTCRFLTVNSGALEKWVYKLPLLTLRNRTPISIVPEGTACASLQVALSAGGVFVDQSLYLQAGGEETADADIKPLPVLRLRHYDCDTITRTFVVGNEKSFPGQPEVSGRFAVSPVYDADGARVFVFDLEDGRTRAELILAQVKRVSTRLTEKTLCVADDCGRLLVLDLERNCLIRNLRI
jgi:hypothetical protein